MPVRDIPSHPEFSVTASEDGERTRLAVSGEVDLVTAPEVAAAAEEHLARGPVLLDLAEVGFLDSSGIRVLDGLMRLCSEKGFELRVDPRLRANVRQVLDMTGMLQVLPMEAE